VGEVVLLDVGVVVVVGVVVCDVVTVDVGVVVGVVVCEEVGVDVADVVGVVVAVVVGVVVGVVVTVVVDEVVGVDVIDVVTVVVGVVVALVVGVVTTQSLKPPPIHASVISFSVNAAAEQLVLSMRKPPRPQLTSSATPAGPLNSRIASLTAVAAEAQELPAYSTANPVVGSSKHDTVAKAAGQAARMAFTTPT